MCAKNWKSTGTPTPSWGKGLVTRNRQGKEVHEAKLRATEMLQKAPLGEKSAAIHLFMVNESDSRRDSWTDSLRDILSNK